MQYVEVGGAADPGHAGAALGADRAGRPRGHRGGGGEHGPGGLRRARAAHAAWRWATRGAEPLGFSGTGAFRGRWRGTRPLPPSSRAASPAPASSTSASVGDEAEWAGAADAREVRSQSLVLRRPGRELWLDGRMETGDLRRARRARRARPLLALARRRLRQGPGLGRGGGRPPVRRGGRLGPPQRAHRPGAGLERVRPLSRRALHGPGGGRPAPRVRHRGPHGPRARGRRDRELPGHGHGDDVYDGTAAAADIDVGELLPSVARGGLGRPRLGDGDAPGDAGRAPAARALDLAPPVPGRRGRGRAGGGPASARATARVAVEARCRSPRVDLALRGSVGAASPHAADLQVTARETSVDPFLRAVYPALPAAVGLVTSGDVRLSGPLAPPRRARGRRRALQPARCCCPSTRCATAIPCGSSSITGPWTCGTCTSPAKAPTWRWRAGPRSWATAPWT